MSVALLPPAPVDADAGARNVRLLSILRMLAIGGQLATILFVHFGLDVRLPLGPMLGALAILLVLNLLIAEIASRRAIGDVALCATLFVDVICLTVQLYLSGGVTNPFVSLYLLQVVIAAVLLPIWASWTLVVLTSLLLGWLTSSPFALPPPFGATLSGPFELGSWTSYTLAASLLVLFVTRIVRNLAEREAKLAALRQRAVEEEHIVRMGLLASGAAHELGTPLSSLAVMIGDWRRDPAVRRVPALLADAEAMAGEIARCKDILRQILFAAGEVRGEMPVRTTIGAFVRGTVDGWAQGVQAVPVDVRDHGVGSTPIVGDTPLAQTIVNLLDNAAEADATRIAVDMMLEEEWVVLRVRDDGTGFASIVLPEIGKPYRTTKPSHGAGLGLFLATNVLRTLGGTLEARNGDEGGGVVTLRWPLASMAVEP